MQTNLLALTIAFSLLLPAQAEGKRFPSDFPEAARREILATESALGVDVFTGTISTEYSDERLETLLSGLSSEFVAVQQRHLELLASFVRHVRMPDSALQGRVIPALTLYINERMAPVVSEQQYGLLRVALWAQWQAVVQGIPQPRQRLAFLGEHVRVGVPDREYYIPQALDYIAEIATDEAIELLSDKLTEATSEATPRDFRRTKLVQAIQESLERAQMNHRLRPLSDTERIQELAALFAHRREQLASPSPAAKSFVTWLVRNLEELGGPEAVEVLERIWQDPGYKDPYANHYANRYRYRAQEALIRLGYVEPDDRTVLYDL